MNAVARIRRLAHQSEELFTKPKTDMDDEPARLMEKNVSEVFGQPDRTLRNVAMFAGYTIVRLARREALKILCNDVSVDDDYRRRFIREADLAAALWHPNIVRVNDRGGFNGQLWISMDFVDGTDAASLLRERYPVGMPADQVATIIAAIAGALDYAHQHHDLLHRDVSPANILLTKSGDGEQRILLGDFGIARNIGDTSGLTATCMTMGTFPYAAPEQLTGEPIDGRADQYALAASAYHLLTGSTLFPHSTPAVVISHHLTAAPPALARTRPKLAAFDPVLAVALAKDLPTDSPGALISPARSQRQGCGRRRQPRLAPWRHPWRAGHPTVR
jgi:serine/threonine protein kinase